MPAAEQRLHTSLPEDLPEDAGRAVLDKIVTQRRGGFCYELNSAFAWLLERCGMAVDLLQARVYAADGAPGPPFDRPALEAAYAEHFGLAPSLVPAPAARG